MIEVSRAFHRLLLEAERWGVPVEFFDGKALPSRLKSPRGSGGILWLARTIAWRKDRCLDAHCSEFVHELNHILADQDPRHVDEVNGPMLFLDFLQHRRSKIPGWSAWMDFFYMPEEGLSVTWTELDSATKHTYLQASRAQALAFDLVDEHDRFTYRRGTLSRPHGYPKEHLR